MTRINIRNFWETPEWRIEIEKQKKQYDTEALQYLRVKFPDTDEKVFYTDYTGRIFEHIPDAVFVCQTAETEKICSGCNGGECTLPIEYQDGTSHPVVSIKEHSKGFKFLDVRWVCGSACKYEPLNADFKRMFEKSGLLKSQLKMTFENYNHCNNREIKQAIGQALLASREKSSLVLAGKPGTGKTHLAIAIAIEAMKNRRQAIFRLVNEMLDEIRKTVADKGDYFGLMEIFKKVPCLVLDDLGKEKTTEAGIDYLHQIIDYRYRHKLQTIITTNARNSAELSLWGSPEYIMPIISRIMEHGAWVTIDNAADFRVKISESRVNKNAGK